MAYGTLTTAICPCGWRSNPYKLLHFAVKAADKHYAVYHKGQSRVIELSRQDATK